MHLLHLTGNDFLQSMGIINQFKRWSQRVDIKNWLPVDIVLDVLTFMDIILLFVTGIITSDEVIKDYRLIAKRYIK